MNEQETYAVKLNFQHILRECSSASLLDRLLDRMFSKFILDRDEYQILLRMHLGKEKLRTLLSLLLDKRGSQYRDIYNLFIEGLRDDIRRPDIANKIMDSFRNAPRMSVDEIDDLNEDFRTSTALQEYGRRPANSPSCASPSSVSSTALSPAIRYPLNHPVSIDDDADDDDTYRSLSVTPHCDQSRFVYHEVKTSTRHIVQMEARNTSVNFSSLKLSKYSNRHYSIEEIDL